MLWCANREVGGSSPAVPTHDPRSERRDVMYHAMDH